MDLLQQIVARAKADKQRIVLPEAEEERTLKAADKVLADDLADIILIGNPANIKNLAAQQLNDGSFEFVPKPQLKTQSLLIKKLAHGRVSKTKDGAIQLTLKVYCNEGVNISETIAAEAEIARDAIVEYQLKR